MDKFNLAGLGGTFDHLHEGHKMLLSAAFKIAKHVAIAICTDKLLQNKKDKDLIESYEVRVKNVENFLINELKISKNSYEIIPLDDPFGPAISSTDLEVHVSSEETIENSKKINQIRIQKGLKPLYLLMIPLVLDEHGRKVSSSDIREKLKRKEIN
jgi:pantetheine-phosphate adenylyltransferase